MTKTEQRVRNFSSGLKNLSENSQDYMNKLTQNLYFIEQATVFPVLKGKKAEMKNHKPVKGYKEIL